MTTVDVKRLDETAHLLVCALRNVQTALTESERMNLWLFLRRGYCSKCGGVTEFICHCENDE